jgi:thiaminase (transcriptional activator TenA)
LHAEWITLHDNPDFRIFAASPISCAELDRVGPAQADFDFFRRAIALELSFFEAVFANGT